MDASTECVEHVRVLGADETDQQIGGVGVIVVVAFDSNIHQ